MTKRRASTKATGPEMTQFAFRLEVDLVRRIEAHVTRLREGTPGVNVTRADALRALLLDALKLAEKKTK